MARAILSVSEFRQLRASSPCVIIDTRDAHSYAQGHIDGAVNIYAVFAHLATTPLHELNARREEFARELGAAGLSGEETAVIYEQSTSDGFGQSSRAYLKLKYLGYPKVVVLEGGFEAWVHEGGEVSTDVPTPAPKTFPLDPLASRVLVDAEAVLEAVQDPETALLDVRSLEEWLGESDSPYGLDIYPRKGRLPGALWIDWDRMMKPSGAGRVLKSPDELRADIAGIGITPETPVIVYCLKGSRAANAYLALQAAGFEDVRVYLGSWHEWSQDESLPIESGAPLAMTA